MRIRLKIFPVIIFSSCVIGIFAQNNSVPIPSFSPANYAQLKSQGKIPKGPVMITGNDTVSISLAEKKALPLPSPQNVLCSCMIPIDASFQVAPFLSGAAPEFRNDDGSTPAINLPFNFCFYGQQMNSCYINNNGNISFNAPYATFSSFTFPNPNFVMIAPFW